MVKSYFFDSYAFYEIVEGNPNYEQYCRDVVIYTTRLNLMELHYGLLIKYGKKTADALYDKLLQYVIDIDDTVIKKANEFRSVFRKRKLSYVDCIGYIISQSIGVLFLTGDQQFKDMDNVEFVK